MSEYRNIDERDVLDDLCDDMDGKFEANCFGDGFVCRHGYEIELDGTCPEGCESPLKALGMI